jgi:hypothetical protein
MLNSRSDMSLGKIDCKDFSPTKTFFGNTENIYKKSHALYLRDFIETSKKNNPISFSAYLLQ